MLAYRYLAKLGGVGYPGTPHNVTTTDDEFVAACGERWGRKEDGGILPDEYRGDVCEACKAVT